MKNKSVMGLCAVLAMAAVCVAAGGSWLTHVPEADRTRVNPYAGREDAVAAGGKLYQQHCAACHGDDAAGLRKRPSLRSARVQGAKDGELFWLLKNGNLAKGMPTWAALPEPMRWQIVTYVKSLSRPGNGAAVKSGNGVGR